MLSDWKLPSKCSSDLQDKKALSSPQMVSCLSHVLLTWYICFFFLFFSSEKCFRYKFMILLLLESSIILLKNFLSLSLHDIHRPAPNYVGSSFAILLVLSEFSFMWSQADLTGEVCVDCSELEGKKKVRIWIRGSEMKTGANVRN